MQTVRAKQKPSERMFRGFFNKSLTMTYFHTGCSTIIGAKSFHGPVRDGKGWYQLAMVIRHNLYRSLFHCCGNKERNLEEVVFYTDATWVGGAGWV